MAQTLNREGGSCQDTEVGQHVSLRLQLWRMKDANFSPEGAIGLFEEVCGCHRPAGYGVHFYFFSLSLKFFCIHGLLNVWALNVYTLSSNTQTCLPHDPCSPVSRSWEHSPSSRERSSCAYGCGSGAHRHSFPWGVVLFLVL